MQLPHLFQLLHFHPAELHFEVQAVQLRPVQLRILALWRWSL
jgi:hypothetical protein